MMKRTPLLGLLLIFLLPAIAIAGNVTGVTDDEVVVGMNGPLSGPGAAWGIIPRGAKAWAEHINDQGGIHGRKIKTIILDDAYNPARTLANLQQMKNKVFAVLGVLGTAPCAASKDFFWENKIPMIHGYGNMRIYAGLPKDKLRWYFTAYPDYEDETVFQITYAVEKLNSRKIAHFYQNDDWGHQSLIGLKRALKESGQKAELVTKVPYEFSERALSTHAMKLKESGADTVLITGSATHTALIVKTMAKIGFKPKVLTNFVLADPIMHRLVGKDWVGTYATMAGQLSMPGSDPAADKIVDILMKYEPDVKGKEYLALFGAVTMMHFIEGLQNAGRDLTREDFIKGMEQIKNWRPYDLGCPVTYGPNRRMGVNAIRMTIASDDGMNHPITDYVLFEPRF